MNNKKGYILVLVLGSVAVMLFLASTLYNYTSTRTFWTYKHTKKITDVASARSVVDQIAADIEHSLYSFRNTEGKLMNELHTDFYNYYTTDLVPYYSNLYCEPNEECIKIRDLSIESCNYNDGLVDPCYTSNSYSYAYEIVYEDDVVATKKFFVSMIPSFLQFALGSSTDITINGGAYIDGNIYTGQDFYLSDVANYIKSGQYNTVETVAPTVSQSSNLFLGRDFNYCKDSTSNPCYTIDTKFNTNESAFITSSNTIDYQNAFHTSYPKVMNYNQNFLEVDYEKSYIYYLRKAAGQSSTSYIYDDFKTYVNSLIQEYSTNGNYYVANSIADISDQQEKSVILSTDYRITFNKDIQFNKDQWIIIDGDLYIENYFNEEITIDANIMVTGNVVITGNVAFDSTIYSLGLGLVHGANIKGVNTSQLILLTYDDLEFSVINTLENDFVDKVCRDPFSTTNECYYNYEPDLKGFFFTNEKAAFYGVASYINIEGGIYTKDTENLFKSPDDLTNYTISDTDSIGLLINSYRGSVTEENDAFQFSPSSVYTKSRVVIRHNPSIFKNLNQGLPINDQVNYAFENTIVR
ncbi:hypothetical protein [Haloplasma contractile]|uniref:Uncharacterized protein n=1 Tax=Haloplasma contractile SSD-17B TaxID=1033810 RepID=U2E049_9MOLU|nr:hypothetical protein [Haloplasma contractile]ERJ13807.1 hypothetical protein HLPCO_000473 [Haloplasma contractile SSD-17B]